MESRIPVANALTTVLSAPDSALSGVTREPTPSPAAALTATPLARNLLQLRLRPGTGNNWCFYNGNSRNPLGVETRAIVSAVKNTTNKRIGLNFWSASGTHAGPVALSVGQTSDAFNGLDVAGTWKASISGTEADAPAVVILEIAFELF